MRYETRIAAYDVLDQVWVTARLWETDGVDPAVAVPVVERSVSFAGEGVSDPQVWLRDALVALLESL